MKRQRTTPLLLLIASGIFLLFFYFDRLYGPPVTLPEIVPLQKAMPLLTSNPSDQVQNVVTFKDVTFISGITHRHNQKKDKLSSFEDSMGAGICVADFNNDGWDDLFFVAGSGNRRHFGGENWWQEPQLNQFYTNHFGQFFINSTATSGITTSGFGIACATADLNNDGLIDIIVANKGKNAIYKNLGNGSFEEIKDPFKDDPELFSTSILVRDFNNDGIDDVLFGNYVTFNQEQNVLELNAGFETKKAINFDSALYDAQPDTLYLGDSDFHFTRNMTIVGENKHGRTLGFFTDSAVIALNDRGSPSQIVYSNGSPSEIDSIVLNARDAKKINAPKNSQESLLLASDASKGGVYAITLDGKANDKSWDYRINQEKRLYANTWAILTGDFNLDGHDDIFLSNGSIMPHPDSSQTPTPQPNTLLIANLDQQRFDYQTLQNERVLSSRGAATLDFNNDGKLDIVINNNNDSPTLLVNTTEIAKRWLGLKCFPEFLCKKAQVLINKKDYGIPFKATQSYASQSTAPIIGLANEIVSTTYKSNTNITLRNDNINVTFSIDETNSYYQIDLEKKSISKIAAAPQKHSSNDLSEREEFISLLRNKLTGDRFTELVENLSTTDKENQLVIISAIKETQNRKAFPLIDLWATSTDDDVALGSIELLKELEIEESVPTLINLTGSSKSQISCAAIKAFEYFYWKDEAVPERKGWAVTELIQRLKTPDPAAIACAIDALAESESFRAVRPLVSLLKSDNNTIGMKAARALGMIRQTEAIPDLGPWK